jgi:hypothetical protein
MYEQVVTQEWLQETLHQRTWQLPSPEAHPVAPDEMQAVHLLSGVLIAAQILALRSRQLVEQRPQADVVSAEAQPT